MIIFRHIFLVFLLAAAVTPEVVTAADTSGLWLASVSVNKVGEANRKIQDSVFDLGVSAVRPEQQLIAMGSSGWSFYADGPLQPNWPNLSSFSSWPAGKTPLGYQLSGGSYIAQSGGTKVSFGSDPANKNLTTYFRKTFTVNDLAGASSLRMKVWFDDAIRIYLNNVPVYSDNVTADWSLVTSGAFAHSAGIRNDGSLWLWGKNDSGQVGDATVIDKSSPVQILPGSLFSAVAPASSSTAAIRYDGALLTWGKADYGQLGTGTTSSRNTPQQAGTDTDWSSISAGWDYYLAVKSNGTLWGWGKNDTGQLGVGSTAYAGIPTQIGTDATWKSIAAGKAHAAGIKNDGSLWLWGWNANGQLGNNSITKSTAPARIGVPDSRWTSVAVGYTHTVAIREDGTLWSWGRNSDGRLGLGSITGDQLTPQMVGTDNDWASVAAGDKMSLAIKMDGTLWGWGTATFGISSTSSTYSQPFRISTDMDWQRISVAAYNNDGAERVMALRGAGINALWGWGANLNGRLGDGTTVDRPLATALASYYSAIAESGDSPSAYRLLSVPTALLTSGENSVAVEVYGAGTSNPDLYFDMELTGLPVSPTDLISDKSNGWKYLDSAAAAPASWNLASFVDTAWPPGAAPLGFGRTSTITTIQNKSTVYFRKSITITNPTTYSALNLRLLRDDGAVVYMNGKEIMRSNMPSGTITFNTPPEQAIGPVDADRYVTLTVPLAAGDLINGINQFAVELHQYPSELATATTLGALTPASADFPLRLLLHVDTIGTIRLLKESIIMKDSNNKLVVVADSALTSAYRGISMRGSSLVGLRTSAIGYDFSGSTILCSGAMGTSGDTDCALSLSAGDPANPFLHRFHPDHDNLDEQFTTELQGGAAESFDLSRKIRLTFSSRYPANPDEPERPATSKPPGWGATQLGGLFSETITGLHKDTLSVSGWFTMKRISTSADLRR